MPYIALIISRIIANMQIYIYSNNNTYSSSSDYVYRCTRIRVGLFIRSILDLCEVMQSNIIYRSIVNGVLAI